LEKDFPRIAPRTKIFLGQGADRRGNQDLVEYPDRRIKPIVYTICSSGIRLGAWDYLRWKDVEPIIENEEIVTAKLTVYDGTDEQYTTFITPEAYGSLKQWIEFREKSGERVTGESWLMAELDKKENLAFGYANLNDDTFAEWGYISLDELTENKVIKCHSWQPCSFEEAQRKMQKYRRERNLR
jgi:hypothetical protein